MQKNIDDKSYNLNKDQQFCEFKINKNIQCIEYGYNEFRNYTIAAVDSPILGCLQYYLNIFGFRNDEGFFSKSKLAMISVISCIATITGIFLILNILRNARTKFKKLREIVRVIPDKEWQQIYSQIPIRILKVCCLTLTSQLVIYSFMAYQFSTRDKF